MGKIIVDKKRVIIKKKGTRIYPTLVDLEITPKAEEQIFTHEGEYGYDKVTVRPIELKLQDKEANIQKEQQVITADDDYDALSSVTINAPELQYKIITPSEEEQEIYADDEYFALDSIVVEPIPEEYTKVEGTIEINSSGEYDVKQYEKANVNITGADPEMEISFKSAIDKQSLGSETTKLPSGISIIRDYAFYGCTNFALKSLPDTLTRVYQYGFYGCIYMDLTELPESLTTIDNYGFANCKYMKLTSFPQSLRTMGQHAFDTCENITATLLPEVMGRIEPYVFYNCKKLALTKLPEGLTYIGQYAFYQCSKLDIREIPEGVVTFNNSSFAFCTSLKYLDVLSTNFTGSLGASAFSGCSKLETIIFRSTKVPTFQSYNAPFNNTPISKGTGYIYVPDEMIESYKSATGWSGFGDQIKGISELPVQEG